MARTREDYNWNSTGPDGCDSHCIPHPCGRCAEESGHLPRLPRPPKTTITVCAECEEEISFVGEPGDKLCHCYNCQLTEGDTKEVEVTE